MVRILVTTPNPGDAVERLSKIHEVDPGQYEEMTPPQLLARAKNCDAVVCALRDKFDRPTLEALPRLKVIANVAVGFDNIDVEAACRQGILVLNTPGVLTDTTADLAFALMLAVARRLVECDKFVRDGNWQGWRPDLLLGLGVSGKTLGIIGFGRIGQALARRALGFNMSVIYSSRLKSTHYEGAEAVPLGELLRRSDFISLHTPLTAETHHLIGREELAAVKPSCILINTARGAIVDEAALIEALKEHRLYGAGLDVFEDEPQVPQALKQLNQVVLLPHVGSATVETRAAMAWLAVDGVIKAFSGEKPGNAVNPQIWKKALERIKS